MKKTIILRAHTEFRTKLSRREWIAPDSPTWPPYALVFDCETRTGELQSLTFGFAQLLRNVHGNYGDCRVEIIFYDPEELKSSEVRVLKRYVRRNRAKVSQDVSSKKILLLTKQQFIYRFLFPHVEAESLIVGFNLCFDLTRLVSDARAATRINDDWSLVFEYRDRKTKQIREDTIRRIKITRKDGKIAFIKLSGYSTRRGVLPSGRFLDLFTLAWALRNVHYSLQGLADDLGVPGKLDHVPKGKVTRKEIKYCRQDVRATIGILNALRTEFDCHPIDPFPDDVYSPASFFKAYLQIMKIKFPWQKFRLSRQLQGIAAQAYYGGRSEVKIRLAHVPVVHCDFLSEYPTVITLMGIWNFVRAAQLRVQTATEDTRNLLKRILNDPDSVFNQTIWEEFTGYALIEPDNDILPIRTEYNESTVENNIGVNVFERSDFPIWFAIPDLIASVLLTGKVPKVLKAIRIVHERIQKGLLKTKLRGKEEVDPISGNLFKTLIEAKERERKGHDEDQAYFLKIMANSGYGIFIETTPRRVSKPKQVAIFSGEFHRKTKSPIVEDKGKFYCPVISSLITAAGRLLLAILEREVREARGSFLLCDTDSMAIVATQKSRSIRLTDPESAKQQKVKSLSWQQVEGIVSKFERLNPYSFPGSILKIEKDSTKRQLYGFGVSAKRYCLFDEQYGIVHASSHGLGYLYVPGSKWDKEADCPEWIREAWEFIIEDDPQAKVPPWFSSPAMMRIGMTTPKVQLWRAISEQPQKLPYRLRFKPFNFVVSPIIAECGIIKNSGRRSPKRPNEKVLLIAPFSAHRKNWYAIRYTNVSDDRKFSLVRSRPNNADEAVPFTLGDIVRMHTAHPESKSLAPDGGPCTGFTRGLLQRSSIRAQGIPRLIGKETDRKWEQDEDPSFFEPLLVEYRFDETARITTDAKLQNAIRDSGNTVRELAQRTQLNPSTVQRAAQGKRIRKSSAATLWEFLKSQRRSSVSGRIYAP